MDEMTRSTDGRRRRSPTTSFVLANVFLSTLILFSCSTTTGTTTPTPTPAPTPTHKTGEVVAPTPHRMLSSGKIIGTSGRYGGLVWRGIPYARPPVGERRFRAPNPASSWEGTREALRFGSPCPQYASETNAGEVYSNGDIVGSEDCLFLNVYAPTEASPSKDSTGGLLPVLFRIHGGGNTSGTASFYDGSRLAQEHQVLVVTINYRLGFLGWFRHRALRAGADAIDGSGNFGTLDQILALDWVQSNIDAFGYPTNVTIFGESAGAWNVISLMASPLAAGKFHRAIAQSPVTWSFSAAAAENYVDDAQPGRPSSSNEAIVRMMIAGGHAADRDGAKAEVAAMDDASLSRFLRAKSVVELFAIQDLIEPL
jgi:para-nitrobenzyl esterase